MRQIDFLSIITAYRRVYKNGENERRETAQRDAKASRGRGELRANETRGSEEPFSGLALISFAWVNDFFPPNQVIPYLFKIISPPVR